MIFISNKLSREQKAHIKRSALYKELFDFLDLAPADEQTDSPPGDLDMEEAELTDISLAVIKALYV